MRTRTLLVAILLALVLPAVAGARAAWAAPTNVLVHDGRCQVGSNWSLGVTPGPWDALVPAGKVLRVEGRPCSMRSLDVEGEVVGAGGTLSVGNSLRAEGPAGLDVAFKNSGHVGVQSLNLTGSYVGTPQILDFGPSEPSVWSLYIQGSAHYELGEDAHFQTAWQMSEGTWFDTGGHNIGGMGWTTLSLPGITLKLHGSEWDTGEWRVGSEVALEAQNATIYEDDGSYGILEGHGQTLGGRVIIENHRPHIIESFTTDQLELRQTADGTPVVFAGLFLPNERPEGKIHLSALATNGTETTPVVTEGKVTLVIPHDITVTGGCLNLNEVTVEGGLLHDPCGTGTGNTNVIFGP